MVCDILMSIMSDKTPNETDNVNKHILSNCGQRENNVQSGICICDQCSGSKSNTWLSFSPLSIRNHIRESANYVC